MNVDLTAAHTSAPFPNNFQAETVAPVRFRYNTNVSGPRGRSFVFGFPASRVQKGLCRDR